MDITFPTMEDLEILLEDPNLNQVGLSSGFGGVFGNNLQGTCYDQVSTISMASGTAPYNGVFDDEWIGGPGSGFNLYEGFNPNGFWNIQIYNLPQTNTGTLDNLTLNFTIPVTSYPDTTASCSVTIDTAFTASDNCDGLVDGVPHILGVPQTIPFTITTGGTTIVQWVFTDTSGNSSDTITQNVIINDLIPPVALCQDTTVFLNGLGTVTITASMIDSGSTDNCGIDTIFVTPNTFDCTDLGANAVLLTVVDNNGNASNCNATVTVLDTIDPTITCPSDQIVGTGVGCNAVVNGIAPSSSGDNCSGPVITYAITGATTASGNNDASGTTFNEGVSIVTYTITDGSTNTATCSFTVTVNDVTPPTISCPTDQVVNAGAGCNAVVNGIAPTASGDNCSVLSITYNITGATTASGNNDASGTTFNEGVSIVTYTITDGSTNTATCSFTVTVNDVTPPTISCPTDQVVNAGAGCNAIVNGIAPTASGDNCSVLSITYNVTGATTASGNNDASGTTFNLGISTITYTITDGSTNTATCSFTVTVNDVTPPTISCPTDQVVNTGARCNAIVNGIAPTSSGDNCSVLSITYDITGATTASGNNDASGTTFNLGISTITYTITDGSTNTATCSFTVTVNDVTPPTISCPTDQVVNTGAGVCTAVVNGIAPTSSGDNCSVLSITYNITGTTTASGNNDASGTTFNEGVSIVTYTITDGATNTATCSFTVTVNDTELPTVSCNSITVNPTAGNPVTVTPGMVITGAGDNCGVLDSTVVPNVFSCAQDGDTVNILITVTDINGNINTCNAQVFVVGIGCDTNDAPIAVCQNLNLIADGGCTASAVAADFDGGSSDPNGDTLSFTVIPAGPYGIGVTNVLLIVSDGSLSDTCAATITVNDVTSPTISCPSDQVVNTGVGVCTAVVNGIAPTASGDNCSILSITYDITGATTASGNNDASGTTFNEGVSIVTYTITDGSTNTATCSFTVTVNDIENPTITCPSDTVVSTDAGLCTYSGTIGTPEIGRAHV